MCIKIAVDSQGEGSRASKNKKNGFRVPVSTSAMTSGHGDVGTCPDQVLEATLTLSQPGGHIMPTLY